MLLALLRGGEEASSTPGMAPPVELAPDDTGNGTVVRRPPITTPGRSCAPLPAWEGAVMGSQRGAGDPVTRCSVKLFRHRLLHLFPDTCFCPRFLVLALLNFIHSIANGRMPRLRILSLFLCPAAAQTPSPSSALSAKPGLTRKNSRSSPYRIDSGSLPEAIAPPPPSRIAALGVLLEPALRQAGGANQQAREAAQEAQEALRRLEVRAGRGPLMPPYHTSSRDGLTICPPLIHFSPRQIPMATPRNLNRCTAQHNLHPTAVDGAVPSLLRSSPSAFLPPLPLSSCLSDAGGQVRRGRAETLPLRCRQRRTPARGPASWSLGSAWRFCRRTTLPP